MAYTQKSWSETLADLRATFDRWGVADWSVTPRSGSRKIIQSDRERTVTVRWALRGEQVVVTLAQYERDAENLRAIYNSIEALRLIESRGVSGLVRDIFAQLPPPAGELATTAPSAASDPYATLGVTRTLPLAAIEAVWKALLREAHPDAGGSTEHAAVLNAAMDAIRKERSP